MKSKVLIIGSGSIAKRHYAICQSIFDEVFIYSKNKNRRKYLAEKGYMILENIKESFNLIIISSAAVEHINDFKKYSKYSKKIIIEKPLISYQHFSKSFFHIKAENIIIGFNKRFEKGILKLKEILNELGNKIISSDFVCHSNLKNWRKEDERKISESISLNFDLGGGVTNELSHEIDLAEFLVGEIRDIYGTKTKKLYKNSKVEDSALLFTKHKNKVISKISISFAYECETRYILFELEGGYNLMYDHLSQTIKLTKGKNILLEERLLEERNESFKRQIMMYMSLDDILESEEPFCSFSRGLFYQEKLRAILWK